MANTTLQVKIQHRIDTKTNWELKNPVLLNGEIGIIFDTNEIKIGDGITPFTNLKATTISGNAETASKLETARNIELSGDAEGITSFNGSENVNINVTVNKISGQSIVNSNSSIQDILNWLASVSS